tara:strand:+ start:1130 stop:1252 length:123 start_codon:yes stop_codon:yes gene_type:complete
MGIEVLGIGLGYTVCSLAGLDATGVLCSLKTGPFKTGVFG